MFNIEYRYGMTRHVLLIGNVAIKFPRVTGYSKFYGFIFSFITGWLANRHEYRWYKYKGFGFLCEVKLSLFFSIIIVMERLTPITEEEFKTIPKFCFNGYEHKFDGLGKDDKGKIFILDYGN